MRCAKKSNPDWSVFAPVKGRIEKLLGDGVSRSTQEVLDAIRAKSNCHVRTVLRELLEAGTVIESYEKRDRHIVACFRLAPTWRRLRPVPKAVPSKRG